MQTAHIDAQDEAYALPLREYLSTHDVVVTVNGSYAKNYHYSIVVGDTQFVKQIISRASRNEKKQLIICVDGNTPYEFDGQTEAKIAFVDARDLTEDIVLSLFDFFFTSGKSFLNLQTGHHRNQHDQDNNSENDQARIAKLIHDVFDTSKPAGKNKKRFKIFTNLFFLFLAFLVPFLWYMMSITAGGIALYFSASALERGEVKSAQKRAGLADYWIRQGSVVTRAGSYTLSFFGKEDALRPQERLLSLLADGSTAVRQVAQMTESASRVASGLIRQVDVTATGGAPAADVASLRMDLASVGNTLSLAQSQLSILLASHTFPFSFSFIEKKGEDAVARLARAKHAVTTIDQLLALFSQVSGFKEPKTYLILLQNSMELRPTGGFIGSVALATFDGGRLLDFTIQDVYTYDGQLKGHVDPPLPIREILGVEHWYLRDSNWDPDFLTSAQKASWFFQKESGMTVDGVIGISVPFLIRILEAVGPIDLPDYNERITADNFFGKSLYYTQHEFFPGSTQKKDFLGTLMRNLMETVTADAGAHAHGLFDALSKSLVSHDILMMFEDDAAQSLVERYGWAGRVPAQEGCAGMAFASCVFDPVMLVEANLGVNKVNYFVTRSIARNITVHTDGGVSERVTVLIKNSQAPGEGAQHYKAYVRLFIPKDTLAPQVIDVPPGGEQTLIFEFTRPIVGEISVLDVFTQKQPGVSGTPVSLTIEYPQGWVAGVDNTDFVAKEQRITYNTILDRDALVRIRFTK